MRVAKRSPLRLFFRMDDTAAGVSRDVSTAGAFLEPSNKQAPKPIVGSTHEVAMVWGDITVRCLARVVRQDSEGFALEFEGKTGVFKQAIIEALSDDSDD